MPIPFAQIDSEGSHVTNLQLYFWRNSLEHFDQMCEIFDDYVDEEASFCVDASIMLVLAGTSVSQLLGQQWRDGIIRENRDDPDRVPRIQELLDRMISDADERMLDGISPTHIKSAFDEFVEVYDGIRHFGEPKYEVIAALTYEKVTEFMETLQDVWHIVAKMRPSPTQLNPEDFDHDFRFPEPSEKTMRGNAMPSHTFYVEATIEAAFTGDSAHKWLTQHFYAHDMDFTVRDGAVIARVQDTVDVDLSGIGGQNFLSQLKDLWQLSTDAFKEKHNCEVFQLQVCITDSEL